MTDAEPSKPQPVHIVEVEPGHGPTLELQARPFDALSEDPYVDLTFKLFDQGEAQVTLSSRYGLSLDDLDELVAALTQARADAVAGARLFGWEPGPTG